MLFVTLNSNINTLNKQCKYTIFNMLNNRSKLNLNINELNIINA